MATKAKNASIRTAVTAAREVIGALQSTTEANIQIVMACFESIFLMDICLSKAKY